MRAVGRFSEGNAVDVYPDGDAAFHAMWKAIRAARRRVWLETYILASDGVGRRTLKLLEQAARRGCEVCVSYDAVGSFSLDLKDLEPLAEAGGRIMSFNPPFEPGGLPPQMRDHRKLLIADGRAFLGGMNVADEYAGTRLGNGFFRDVQASVEGPAVGHLAALFRQVARQVQPGAFPDLDQSGPVGTEEVLVLASDLRRQVRTIQKALRIALHRSERRALLTSPYFLPTPRLARAMVKACKRGVAVDLMTAGKTDSRLARAAGRHVYSHFLRAGVRVRERLKDTLHAKTVLIDENLAFVGSHNLDRWSGARNLELAIAVRAPQVVEALERFQGEGEEHSREVGLADLGKYPFLHRIGYWLAFQLLRL